MLLFVVLCIFLQQCVSADQPHIVVILADDLGYYDTGITNPEAKTPTLVQLAQEGTFLNQSYVQSLCTPSRTAMMTGKYPFHVGMQSGPILHGQPKCLDPSYTLLPEVLREMGYRTHAVGKWHLGFCNIACTPLENGFDSHIGLYGGRFDHLTHIETENNGNRSISGVDFHSSTAGNNSTYGIHSTDIFIDRAEEIIMEHDSSIPLFLWLALSSVHTPLQVPTEYEEMYAHINDTDRRLLLGMSTHMDDGIKKIVDSLKDRDMVENTLLLFLSDNGGSPSGGAYNYPMRGRKGTSWEGGVRSKTVLWGGVLNQVDYVNDGLMHAVDWFPTFVSLAGGDSDGLDLDGVDNSEMIINAAESNRQEMVIQLNEVRDPFDGAIRIGQYKFLLGDPGNDEWNIPPELEISSFEEQTEKREVFHGSRNFYFPEEWDRYMYDLQADPEERYNLINELPQVAEEMERRLAEYDEGRMEAINPPNTPDEADPDLFGGFWAPGWC